MKSNPGIWTKENNFLIQALCRRPIPKHFTSKNPCPNAVDSIQLGTGRVIAWCPSIARIPDLYRVEYSSPHDYSEDVTYEELMSGIASEKKRLATCMTTNELELEKDKMKLYHGNLRKRATDELKRRALSFLPELFVVGAWELQRDEEWKEKYERNISKKIGDMENESTTIPKYYGARHPNMYFREKNKGFAIGKEVKFFSFTPTQINQRVRLGCNLAYNYCFRKKALDQGLHSGHSIRRSTRMSSHKTAEISKPTEYEPGGSIANFLFHKMNSTKGETMEMIEENVGMYYSDDNARGNVEHFFHPPNLIILEYLSKAGYNSFSSADLQAMVVALLRDKIAVNVKNKENAHAELLCATGDSVKDLQEYDTHTFGRCKFCTKTINLSNSDNVSQKIEEKQDFVEAQTETSPQQIKPTNTENNKKFEIQRYLSIHTGCAVWPSWQSHVSAILCKLQEYDPATEDKLFPEENPSSFAPSLVNTSSRRSKRATQSDSANLVFYGAGAAMTQKLLTESIYRLIVQAFPGSVTSLDLCRLVSDDIENADWKRVRLTLGRLLCREGRIARIFASTNESDKLFYSYLKKDTNNSLLEYTTRDEVEQKFDHCSKATFQANREHLLQYIRELHLIELHLRSAIINFTPLQVDVEQVASSADDDAALDPIGDEDKIEWKADGHELLDCTLLRPDGRRWCVKRYIPPRLLDDNIESTEILQKSICKVVKCRARFLIEPCDDNRKEPVIVTEAQVRAGINAYELWKKKESCIANVQSKTHPYENQIGAKVTLSFDLESIDEIPRVDSLDYVVATIAGFGENDKNDKCVLLLIDMESGFEPMKKLGLYQEISSNSFWGVIHDNNSITLQTRSHGAVKAEIVFQDYQKDSKAFKACESVLRFIKSNAKSAPFLEPVDTVGLGLDDYNEIIKHPMDLKTLEENLKAGVYSRKVLQEKSMGQASPVKKLLTGEFMTDLFRIFDNAMLYNPKGDWIHTDAGILKRQAKRKIEKIVKENDQEHEYHPQYQKTSIYADESDSAIDEAYLESDEEEYITGRNKKIKHNRKRTHRSGKSNTSQSKDNSSFLASRQATDSIELPQYVPSIPSLLSELENYPIASALKINTTVDTFSLPLDWLCHPVKQKKQIEVKETQEKNNDDNEALEEEILMMMNSRIRRSNRGLRDNPKFGKSRSSEENTIVDNLGFCYHQCESFPLKPINKENQQQTQGAVIKQGESYSTVAVDRQEVETVRENLHESHFAPLYYEIASQLTSSKLDDTHDCEIGLYADDSFPPYLGRIFQGTWEIRAPYIAPALRWVIRGLIRSGHLFEMDPLTIRSNVIGSFSQSSSSGALVAASSSPALELREGSVSIANSYYWNRSPFDVVESKRPKIRSKLDIQEEAKRKKDSERELSEYEQDRAKRIARNQEYLKSLGLG